MRKLIIIAALVAFAYWAHDGVWFLFNIFMRALPDIQPRVVGLFLGTFLITGIFVWGMLLGVHLGRRHK